MQSPALASTSSSSSAANNDKVRATQHSSQLKTPSAGHKLTQAERDAEAIAKFEARFGGGDQSMSGSHLDGTMGKETKRNMFRVI